jgi:hypothetical protein
MRLLTSKTSLLLMMLLPLLATAQKQEMQTSETAKYTSLIPEAKQGLLKNMSMIANMNFAFRNEFQDGQYMQSKFKNEQFRLEFRGMVHDKVFFRFRDRYTRAQTSESMDNLSRSTDLAYIRVDASDRFSISAGKMCADWGAFEFDYNPIDIYEYSDIIEMADNFLTGVGFSYKASDKHQFTFQCLDSRTKTFDELYPNQPDYEESKAPLAFVANWRGSLFGDKVKTIWSYSYFDEAKNVVDDKNAAMNYIALGTELTLNKLVIAYDYKWSDEGLDRTDIVSQTVPDAQYPYAIENTRYIGHWLHVHYRLSEKINLSLFGMCDVAQWKGDYMDQFTSNDNIRTAWGYIPTVEYYPWNNLNLRFFANWVGRVYDYSDASEQYLGAKDYSTGRFTVGFVSPLGIF